MFILSISLLALEHSVQAQQREITETLAALKGEINFRFPIVDSLHPFTFNGSIGYQKDFGLSKQDVSEIKKHNKKRSGIKLDSSFIHGSRLISSQAFYKAYQNGDSLSLSFIEKNKPFYTLSIPIFFNDGKKAVLDIDLIGRGGYTYLLVKKQGKWIIEKEYVRWIV